MPVLRGTTGFLAARSSTSPRQRAKAYLLKHTDVPIPIYPLVAVRHRFKCLRLHALGEEALNLCLTAAASSTLTLLSLRLLETYRNQTTVNRHPNDSLESTSNDPSTTQHPPEPSTPEAVWGAAWAAFQKTEKEAPTVPHNSREHNEAGNTAQVSLMWIQGLRATPRRALLALSLAALEEHISSLKSDTATLINPTQWPDVCMQVLDVSTKQAAQSWLGYVPLSLREADGSERSNYSENYEVETPWYAIGERLPLYSSVLRLLSSRPLGMSRGGDDYDFSQSGAGGEEPNYKQTVSMETTIFDVASLRETAAVAVGYPSFWAENSSNPIVWGWRATRSGSYSSSQLLRLAPSVLQDMAIRVSDAVAAAYFAEAALGGFDEFARRGSENPRPPGEVGAISREARGKHPVVSFIPSSRVEDLSSNNLVRSSRNESPDASPTVPPYKNEMATTPLEPSWWPSYAHPKLSSTRNLQRFSNRIALARWIDRTFFSVADAYEDRLPLLTLMPSEPGPTMRVLHGPVRRSVELSRLRGLRYTVSLALEAADVAVPVLHAGWTRLSLLLTYILVHWLGRALGMLWRGVLSGLRGGSKAEGAGDTHKREPPGDPPTFHSSLFGTA